MANSCVWFDIPANDLDRVEKFYSAVLNVALERFPGMDVLVLPHGDKDVGGCIYKTEKNEASALGPLLYLNVQGRLDDAISNVEPLGGTILEAKKSMGPYGFRALVLDSEGNRIALHSM